jgi:DNA-binding MarR family transcriptional regulator
MAKRQVDPGAARVHETAHELRAVLGRLIRRLREEAEPGDFTSSQKSALGRLEREGPATLSVLARAEGMRPQSMRPIVSVLEEAGLVEGTPHPTDGRQTLLSLTPDARKTIKEGRAAREDWLFHAIASKLSRAEQDHLAHAVGLLERLLVP